MQQVKQQAKQDEANKDGTHMELDQNQSWICYHMGRITYGVLQDHLKKYLGKHLLFEKKKMMDSGCS